MEPNLFHDVLRLVEVLQSKLGQVGYQGPGVIGRALGVDCQGPELEVDPLLLGHELKGISQVLCRIF